jgi:hypothetical protein
MALTVIESLNLTHRKFTRGLGEDKIKQNPEAGEGK